VSFKPDAFQHVPRTPSWEKEVRDTIVYEGLPPLAGRRAVGTVAFVGVRNAWVRRNGSIHSLTDAESNTNASASVNQNLTVIVHAGHIACAGPSAAGACAEFIAAGTGAEVVDLHGGALAPGLTTFGSDLGLSEIMLEPSTTDGPVFDPLTMAVPSILGHTVVRAVDGLQFGGRNTLYVSYSLDYECVDRGLFTVR
jgi:hypothetical protein